MSTGKFKIGGKTFPLDEIIRVEIPTTHITDSGIAEIKKILLRHAKGYYNGGLRALPGDFDFSWRTKHGTFPKRVSKYFFDNYRVELKEETLTALGDLARAHSTDQAEYFIDFTQSFNWSDGDFGDEGSCFWGGREGALEMLADHGAYAIRFYHSMNKGSGYARAWLVEEDPFFIIFNGYGLQTIDIARTLATLTGLSYKKVGLTNRGEQSGELYINYDAKGKGMGFLLGAYAQVTEKNSYRFDWQEVVRPECYHCDENCDDDHFTNENGEPVCDDCYREYYIECSSCDRTRRRGHDDFELCEPCFNQQYYYCNRCGNPQEKATSNEELSRAYLCTTCGAMYKTCTHPTHNHYHPHRLVSVGYMDEKVPEHCYRCAQRDREEAKRADLISRTAVNDTIKLSYDQLKRLGLVD